MSELRESHADSRITARYSPGNWAGEQITSDVLALLCISFLSDCQNRYVPTYVS